MSRGNVEIVQRLYDAWARQELPGPSGLLDPDIEYVNPDGAIEPGTRRGLPAFAAAIEKLLEGWETWEMEPEEFFDAGDRVAVVLRYRAKARRSGVEVDGRESAVVTVRDGKISRYGTRLASPALIADGNHARADAYVSLSVILSAAVVALDYLSLTR